MVIYNFSKDCLWLNPWIMNIIQGVKYNEGHNTSPIYIQIEICQIHKICLYDDNVLLLLKFTYTNTSTSTGQISCN